MKMFTTLVTNYFTMQKIINSIKICFNILYTPYYISNGMEAV